MARHAAKPAAFAVAVLVKERRPVVLSSRAVAATDDLSPSGSTDLIPVIVVAHSGPTSVPREVCSIVIGQIPELRLTSETKIIYHELCHAPAEIKILGSDGIDLDALMLLHSTVVPQETIPNSGVRTAASNYWTRPSPAGGQSYVYECVLERESKSRLMGLFSKILGNK